MIQRSLCDTGPSLSVLGLGTWAFGAGRGGTTGLGPQRDHDSVAAIGRALELGVTWIDTAASYGAGHAERVVARALRGVRERPLVMTKCGTVYDAGGRERHDLRAATIRADVEGSLARLEVDALDLVFVHWPEPENRLEEAWGTLAELRSAGKVRLLGASNFTAAQLARVALIAPVAAVQVRYSLLAREAEHDLLPWCAARGIGVLGYSTLHHGLLTGAMTSERIERLAPTDWRRGHPDFTEPRLSRHLELVAMLDRIGRAWGCGAGEVAVAWALRHAAVTGAIVGARRPEQLDDTVAAARLSLTDDDAAALERVTACEKRSA